MATNDYLIRLFRIAKEMEGIDLFNNSANFSKTEFRMLREIVLEGEKNQKIISSELARRLGVTRSAISQIVTKMEEKNIVKRVDSPTDRKIAYIELSDQTAVLFEEQLKQANAVFKRVMEEYGENNIENLFAMWDEFIEIFSRVRKESGEKKSKQKEAEL